MIRARIKKSEIDSEEFVLRNRFQNFLDPEKQIIFSGELEISGFKKPDRIHSDENFVMEINYAVNTEAGAVASVNDSPEEQVNWTSEVDSENKILIISIPEIIFAHGPKPTLFLTATLIRESRWTILKHTLNKKSREQAFYLLNSLALPIFPGVQFKSFSGYTIQNEDSSFGFTAAGYFVNKSRSRIVYPEVQISLVDREGLVVDTEIVRIPTVSPMTGGGAFEICLNDIYRANVKKSKSIEVDFIAREELYSYSFYGSFCNEDRVIDFNIFEK